MKQLNPRRQRQLDRRNAEISRLIEQFHAEHAALQIKPLVEGIRSHILELQMEAFKNERRS